MKVFVEIMKALGEILARAFMYEMFKRKDRKDSEKDMEEFDESLAKNDVDDVRERLDDLVRKQPKGTDKG